MSFTQGPFVQVEPLTNNYVQQNTLQYSTFIKRALVESLQVAFENHPTQVVRNSQVVLDWTHEEFQVPAIIVRFYERTIQNIGVGHEEWLPAPSNVDATNPNVFIKYYHRLYKGDVEFEVWAASSLERDLLRDALIEVLGMADATNQGNGFLERLYFFINDTPYGPWHFPVLNLDLISGFGEKQQPAPWGAEDILHYSVAYRVPILGEFYSMTPQGVEGTGLVTAVEVKVGQYYTDTIPIQIEETDDFYYDGWFEGARTI